MGCCGWNRLNGLFDEMNSYIGKDGNEYEYDPITGDLIFDEEDDDEVEDDTDDQQQDPEREENPDTDSEGDGSDSENPDAENQGDNDSPDEDTSADDGSPDEAENPEAGEGADATGESAAEGATGAAAEGAVEGAAEEAVAGAAEGAAGEGAAAFFSNPWVDFIGLIILVVLVIVVILVAGFTKRADQNSNKEATGAKATIVCIDPGHVSELESSNEQSDYDRDQRSWEQNGSGANGGTSGNGVVEREVNQSVANLLKTELESRKYKVVMTKNSADDFMSNRARGQFCRDNNADLIVKIHNDGNGPSDGMIFYRSNKTVIENKWDNKSPDTKEYISRRKDSTISEDKDLGESLLEAFKSGVKKYDIKYDSGSNYPSDLLVHPSNTGFGYTYDIPTSLLEMSSLRVSRDAEFIKKNANQKKIVKAFADGIEGYIPPTSGGGAGLCMPLPSPDPDSSQGFARIPKSDDYILVNQDWGTPEMIAMLQGVGKVWHERHPKAMMGINDISREDGGSYWPPHRSHQLGIDVDINSNTDPKFIMEGAGGGKYDRKLSIEATKLFFDTKAIDLFIYNDTEIYGEINDYIKKNKLPGNIISASGHENHFHVRIKPGAYKKACGY